MEVRGEWRKLYNEELNDLYSSPNIVQVKKSKGGECSTYGGEERCMQGKRPLGKLRHRWEDIKMDLQQVGCRGMDWIELAQDRDRWQELTNVVMKLHVP